MNEATKEKLHGAINDALREEQEIQTQGTLQSMPLTKEKFSALVDFVERNVAKGTKEEPPRFEIIAGPVGVGKTTLIKANYADGWVLVDSGETYREIKSSIEQPEHEALTMYLAGNWLVSKAIADRRNILIEINMDKEEPIMTIIQKMKDIGYQVKVNLIRNDIETSWKNNLNRSKDNTSAYYTQDETLSWFVEYFKNLGKE
ncbi:MAG: zeta toxin family protein [Minisyncoccia bacterium]